MAGAALKRGKGLGQQRCGAGHEEADVAADMAVEARLRQQPHVVRGHAHHHGGARKTAHYLGRIELRQEQHARAGQQRRVRGHEQAMHVEQRQRMQQHVLVAGLALFLEAPELVEHQRIGTQVAVAEHRALAAAGGARGVQDGRQILGLARNRGKAVGKRRCQPEQRSVALLAECDHVRHPGDARQRRQFGLTLGRADEHRRLRIAQEVIDLRRLIGGVQRHVDQTGPQRRQVEHQSLRRLLDLHGHARRRAVGLGRQVQAGQPAGQPRARVVQVAPRIQQALLGLNADAIEVARQARLDKRIKVLVFHGFAATRPVPRRFRSRILAGTGNKCRQKLAALQTGGISGREKSACASKERPAAPPNSRRRQKTQNCRPIARR